MGKIDKVGIRTRRLGHVNLFVRKGSLDEGANFYNNIIGLEEIRREPDIEAAFFSNGRTHHDVATIEGTGEERVGHDGSIQIPKGRGKDPGLNHLGWETENEAELVAAYERAVRLDQKIHRLVDHQIAHSLYIFDPDGNLNEWYADIMKDWRVVMNPSRHDLVTGEWAIHAEEPTTEARYTDDPEIRRVDEAIFHPRGVTTAVMVARNFERMIEHYVDMGGLNEEPLPNGQGSRLSGALGNTDMILLRPQAGLVQGMHHFRVKIDDEAEIEAGREALRERGVEPVHEVDNDSKRSLFLADPSGLVVELCATRSGRPPTGAAEGRLAAFLA